MVTAVLGQGSDLQLRRHFPIPAIENRQIDRLKLNKGFEKN